MKPNELKTVTITSSGYCKTQSVEIESEGVSTVHFAVRVGYDTRKSILPLYVQVGSKGFPGAVYGYTLRMASVSGQVLFEGLQVMRSAKPSLKIRAWVNPLETYVLSVICPPSHKFARWYGGYGYAPKLDVTLAAGWQSDGHTIEFGKP